MGIGFLLESTGLLLLALALGKSCSHASRRAALWFGAIAALPLLWLADITGVGWQPLTQPGPATLTAAGSATTAPVSSWWTLWTFYCAISAWRLAIWLRALWASHALRLQSRPCRGTDWLRHSRLLSRALHRRTVPVLVHADIASPFMVGGLYPRIYIPAYLERCEPQRARQVLLHEFAHLRAHDWLRDQLIALVCCVLWFQPLIHRVRTHFRRDIELACDAQVLRAGTDALDYAHTLLHCAERHQRLRAALVAIADQRGQLVQRVAHILEPSEPCASAGLPWAQAALLFGGLLLVSVNLAPRMLEASPVTAETDAAVGITPPNAGRVVAQSRSSWPTQTATDGAADLPSRILPIVPARQEAPEHAVVTAAMAATTTTLGESDAPVDSRLLWAAMAGVAEADARDYALHHSDEAGFDRPADPRFENGLRAGRSERAARRERVMRRVWPFLGHVPL